MFKNIISNKWFTIIFMLIGSLAILVGDVTNYWQPQFVLLPLIYIVVLFVRNNYIWYFIFEFAILAIFALGISILHTRNNPILAMWCAFTGVGISILYLVIVKFMNTRGYPVKKQEREKEK